MAKFINRKTLLIVGAVVVVIIAIEIGYFAGVKKAGQSGTANTPEILPPVPVVPVVPGGPATGGSASSTTIFTDPSNKFTAPALNAVWKEGSTQKIAWIVGKDYSSVKAKLVVLDSACASSLTSIITPPGCAVYDVATVTAGKEEYSWSIPKGVHTTAMGGTGAPVSRWEVVAVLRLNSQQIISSPFSIEK